MPGQWPPIRVFSYGVVPDKAAREQSVLEEFRKAYGRAYSESAAVIPIQKALDDGLIRSHCGETIDGVLQTTQGIAAVELLGYAPLQDRGDVLSTDEKLRYAIRDQLQAELAKQPPSITIHYKERTRTSQIGGGVKHVPLPPLHKQMCEEVLHVIENLPALDPGGVLWTRFSDEEVPIWARTPNQVYLSSSSYPVCYEHTSFLQLSGAHPNVSSTIDSCVCSGWVGSDIDWTRQHIAKKISLSKTHSRIRAKDLPLWLVVHSDGHAINQHIPENDRDGILTCMRNIFAESDHGFDRVYWADRTGFLDAAWVGRII